MDPVALIAEIKKIPIVGVILTQLEKDLSPSLSYHSFQHTLEVIHEAVQFAFQDGLAEYEIQLLGIAAAFHDSGFLVRRVRNEAFGARFAREAMKSTEIYSNKEIKLVTTMIEDTRIKKVKGKPKMFPTTALSKYLLDADLSNFGRDDFFKKLEMVYRESPGQNKKVFYRSVLELLEVHQWFTPAARHLREAQKEENIMALKGMILAEGYFEEA